MPDIADEIAKVLLTFNTPVIAIIKMPDGTFTRICNMDPRAAVAIIQQIAAKDMLDPELVTGWENVASVTEQ